MPHELLELTPQEITLAIACVLQADARAAQMTKRIGTVFPVVMVGGH